MQAAGCRVSAVLDNNALQTFPSIPKKRMRPELLSLFMSECYFEIN